MSTLSKTTCDYVYEVRTKTGRFPTPQEVCQATYQCTLEVAIKAVARVQRLFN